MSSARIWAALQQSAMVGSDRLPVPQVCTQGVDGAVPVSQLALQTALTAPASPGAGHPGVGQPGAGQPGAQQLLRASAVAAVLERAGWMPGRGQVLPPLAPALAETRSAPDGARLSALMREVLQDGPQDALAPMFAALGRAGRRLPHGLLVPALEQGRQSVELRHWLTPVLGERGRWLAALNPQWSYASGVQETADPEQVWQEGSLDQRAQLLRSEREADPAKARARLEASLKELGAKERLPMIQALEQGLSMADEPLLEKLLADRSKDVREAAARLLSCLPESSHCQRIGGWLQSMLSQDAKGEWLIEPPEQGLKDWERDGIALQPPSWVKGAKGWWLQQFAQLAPLGFWMQALDKTPAQLWEWSRRSDWKSALRQGWLEALRYQSRWQDDEGWLELLLGMERDARAEALLPALLVRLAPERREAVWLAQLGRGKGRLVETILNIDSGLQASDQLSPALSARVVDEVFQAAGGRQATGNWYSYQADRALLACARMLDVGALARFAALWRQPRAMEREAGADDKLTPEQRDKLERARRRPWDDERVREQLERSVELRLALHQALHIS